MKFDKETIIALSICMILLILWPFLFPTKRPEIENAHDKAAQSAPPEQNKQYSIKESPQIAGSEAQEKSEESSLFPVQQKTIPDKINLPPVSEQTLLNDFSKIVIDPKSGAVKSITFKKILDSDKKKTVTIGQSDNGAFLISFSEKHLLTNISCETGSDGSVKLVREFRTPDNEPFNLVQTWKLTDKYTTRCQVEIENHGATKLNFSKIQISAGCLPPLSLLAGDKIQTRMERHRINSCMASNNTLKSKDASDKSFEDFQENPAKWIGISNKYFACILLPEQPFSEGNIMSGKTIDDETGGKEKKYALLQTAGIIKEVSVSPGGRTELNFAYFAGPKEISILKKFDPTASEIMQLGWDWLRWFEPIAHGLLTGLIWFKGLCGNYGSAIILLTFIVKMIFWPVTGRANASMRKMQKIQPMVQEIREKYKNDSQKMNSKIMQLYKEHKINPLGGCLPIFLQIPVFFALYWALDGAIELRQAAFLWARDLSKPDTIGVLPGINLPINPLILLMTATMMIQQKLTPTAADPVQQKMMMFLPLVMLVMLYSLPSGLTLYWTVSQIISIIQLLVNKHIDKKEALKTKTA